MYYELDKESKTELEEFADELVILGETLKKITEGEYGAKTDAVKWRKQITEAKKKITHYKHQTIRLFKDGQG